MSDRRMRIRMVSLYFPGEGWRRIPVEDANLSELAARQVKAEDVEIA